MRPCQLMGLVNWSHTSHLLSIDDIYIHAPFIFLISSLVLLLTATEHPFKTILTTLPKPGGGEYGKFYSLPALNDPRIGNCSACILFFSLLFYFSLYPVTNLSYLTLKFSVMALNAESDSTLLKRGNNYNTCLL
jgi:hypothetical protein